MAHTVPQAVQGPRIPGDSTPPQPRTRAKSRRSVFGLVFFALFAIFVLELIGVIFAQALSLDYALAVTAISCVGSILAILAFGAKSALVPSRTLVRDALRLGWSLVAANGLLMVYDLLSMFFLPDYSVTDGWFLRSLSILFYALCVGIGEELMFRGLLLGGFLSKFGDTRAGILKCCLITSLLFGCAHVDWFTLDFTDLLALAQAVLKIAQTTILGYFFASLVVGSKSLVGPSLLHALGDFLLMFPSMGLAGYSTEVSYVNTGEDALPTIVLYAFIIVCYLPLLRSSKRLLADVKAPQYGLLRRPGSRAED